MRGTNTELRVTAHSGARFRSLVLAPGNLKLVSVCKSETRFAQTIGFATAFPGEISCRCRGSLGRRRYTQRGSIAALFMIKRIYVD